MNEEKRVADECREMDSLLHLQSVSLFSELITFRSKWFSSRHYSRSCYIKKIFQSFQWVLNLL